MNLRQRFVSALVAAAVKPWPKPFQNCRATRETELADEYPLHVVTAWLGNSAVVAREHYLQVTEAHFERAAAVPTAGGVA